MAKSIDYIQEHCNKKVLLTTSSDVKEIAMGYRDHQLM